MMNNKTFLTLKDLKPIQYTTSNMSKEKEKSKTENSLGGESFEENMANFSFLTFNLI